LKLHKTRRWLIDVPLEYAVTKVREIMYTVDADVLGGNINMIGASILFDLQVSSKRTMCVVMFIRRLHEKNYNIQGIHKRMVRFEK
jgi:hypothetical protein